MGEPKLVKGMLGWAAIGDGLIVYAKTKAEAQRRFRAAQQAEMTAPSAKLTEPVTDDVAATLPISPCEEP